MAVHPDVSHPELVSRGGWSPDNSSKYYYVSTTAINLRPMRCLQGHRNANVTVHVPRISCLGENAASLAEEVMDHLYAPISVGEFLPGERLRPILRVVFATNVMYFREK